MTTTELIELLQKYPPQTRVVIKGYETGFNDIQEIKELKLELNVGQEWWDGQHEKKENSNAIISIALLGQNKNPKK